MKMLMLLFAFLLHFEMSVSNEWSECSRSCGAGISYKTVSCRRFIDDCSGKKEEYRVCKKEECPDNTTDYRTQQCQEIEEHLVSLSDSTDNSCHVKCRLPGGLPIKSVIAKDGTPCSVSGVCIAGTCVPVGCDGILGSDKRMDKCGRCGATDGVCLHVPCNITKMDKQEKTYHVRLPAKSTNVKLLISSSACNILATNKNQTYSFNKTSVVTISGNKLELDTNMLTSRGPLHEEILIQIQHCQAYEIECKYHIPVYKYTYTPTIFAAQSFNKHEWVIGENYTACSRTCGNGIQRKEVYCRHNETQQRVGDSSCDSKTKPDYHIRDCAMPKCPYIWDIGEWGSCSKSCGGGIRKRAVACVLQRNGSVSVNETACSEPKPVQREHCNQHLCYNHWHKGKYNECSVDCGKGQRRRDVFCLNAHGMKINDSYCNIIAKKPKEVDDCMGDMCSYRWVRSNWSKCFLENGVKIQTRTVECRRVIDNALVNSSICERNISRSKPKTRRTCPCIKTWGYDEWGECQVTDCNKKGTQYRGIYCYCEDTLAIVDGCDVSNKPLTEQACTTDSCPADWVLGPPYTKCNNKSCSKEGTLKCMKQTIEVDEKFCPIHKPSKIMDCDNCTEPVPVCVETDPLMLCKQFKSYTLENNQDARNYCDKHCCVCPT